MAFNLYDLGQIFSGAQGALQDYNQRSALDSLGQDLAGGDYKTASRKLLALGQVGPAVSLMTKGQELEQQKAADAAILPLINGGGLSALGAAAAPVAPSAAPAPAPAPAGGGPFNVSRAFELAKQAGASDDEAKTLAAIAQAESSGNPQAHNTRGPDDSYGLWQINMKGGLGPERMRQLGLSSPDQLYDPATNARAAVALMRARGGFGDWSTYNNGAYKPFLGNSGPVQVADASGAVPATAGRREALMRQYGVMSDLLARSPNASENMRNAIKTKMDAVKFQIDDINRQGGPTDAQRNYDLARRQGYAGSFMDYQAATKGGTTVNLGPNEGEFAKKAAGKQADRFAAISEEGDAARNDLALISQLKDLRGVVGTGGGAAAQAWLAERGIKVGQNVGEIEAYQAIVDKLTPSQRIPGSGTTSDRDMAIFKSSLPSLVKTQEGNAIIERVLSSLAQSKIARADIADRVLSGEISAKDGVAELRKLPSPFEAMKAVAGKEAPPPSQNAPAQQPAPANLIAEPPAGKTGAQLAEDAAAMIAAKPQLKEAVTKQLMLWKQRFPQLAIP